jgi:site-specific recombinase XerD
MKMNDEQKKLLADFLEERELSGSREQHLIGLRNRVPKLFDFLAEYGLKVHNLGVKQAQEYQGWLIETGRQDGNKYSSETIHSFLKAAVSFCEYLRKKGILLSNPFKEIKRIRINKKIPRQLLKEKEMNHFLEQLVHFEKEKDLKNKITRYKVHVIAELMYATGLRISEVAALTLSDIDLKRGIIIVREGKQGKRRVAFLNDYAKEVLKFYIEKMRGLIFSEWNWKNSDLVFGVKWAWLGHVVNKTLNRVAKEAGYEGFTSHGFRHTLGYHLHRAGCNIRHIQEILGHRRLKTTEIYTKVDKENLKEILDMYHPRKRRKKDGETGNGKGPEAI